MKTREQIISGLQAVKEVTFSGLYNNEEIINSIDAFCKQYPQYDAMDSFAIHIVNVSLKFNPVKVCKFSNGDILFIGHVGSSKDIAPLAGIGGNGLPLPNDFKWEKPETFLEIIEILPKWNS